MQPLKSAYFRGNQLSIHFNVIQQCAKMFNGIIKDSFSTVAQLTQIFWRPRLATIKISLSTKWNREILLSVDERRTVLTREDLPLSGIDNRAATALRADLLSSSCFSNSCLTEFAFTFVCNVARKGSTRISTPTDKQQHDAITVY